MTLRQRVLEEIVNHLPDLAGATADLSFFLEESTFPIGDDLGASRQNWHFGFSWLNGLGETSQRLEIVHFQYQYTKSQFKGMFDLGDGKAAQILGDFDPPRGLTPEELDFLKRSLPTSCELFAVGVYRPELNRKTKAGALTFGLDAIVVYYTTTNSANKRVPNPLQQLAIAATATNPSEPSSEPPIQNGTKKGKNFVKNLLE